MRRHRPFILCLLLALAGVTQGAFKFTAWSDNHVTYETYRARFQWLAGQMQAILASAPPEFHISGGDCENGGHDLTSADLGTFCSSCSAWSYVPSNHDTSMWYLPNSSFDQDNARFILLNLYSCHDGVPGCDCGAGRVCPHTLAWLATQLDGSHPFVLVVGHEPAYPYRRHVGDSLDQFPHDRAVQNRSSKKT